MCENTRSMRPILTVLETILRTVDNKKHGRKGDAVERATRTTERRDLFNRMIRAEKKDIYIYPLSVAEYFCSAFQA